MALILPHELQNLPEREQKRLVHEATKPLTPAEMEQFVAGLQGKDFAAKVREMATEIAEARTRFCSDAITAAVRRGEIPKWVLRSDRRSAAREWLAREGFRFEVYTDNPYLMRFLRGDKLLAELRIHGQGEAVQ